MIYTRCVRNMKPGPRERFDEELERPDPVPVRRKQEGEAKPPAWWRGEEAAAREAAQVVAFLNKVGKRG